MATSEAPARSVAPDPLPANLDRWYPNREGVRWSGMPCSPRRRLPTETTIAVVLLALATSGCDDYLKEWREKREAKRQEEADRPSQTTSRHIAGTRTVSTEYSRPSRTTTPPVQVENLSTMIVSSGGEEPTAMALATRPRGFERRAVRLNTRKMGSSEPNHGGGRRLRVAPRTRANC